MANLRVFVSSTCYDLQVVREQLRTFLENFGFTPIMSDYHDVAYDPRNHTHLSCLEEVASCDLVIVLIGSRFGGTVVPEALRVVDIEAVGEKSSCKELLNAGENVSITQLEVLRAIEQSVPIFALVDERVLQDHATFEKNKEKDIIDLIEFSSIERPETAKYIFEFINFLHARYINNGILRFSRYQDIEEILRKQWSGLFQRLLQEQRAKMEESRRFEALTDQFEDLKTAILSSIGSKNERATARGVVKYRRLCDFLIDLELPDYSFVLDEVHSWAELLEFVDIKELRHGVYKEEGATLSTRRVQILILNSGFFYLTRTTKSYEELHREWKGFCQLKPDVKRGIFDTLNEFKTRSVIGRLQLIKANIEEFAEEKRIALSPPLKLSFELQDQEQLES